MPNYGATQLITSVNRIISTIENISMICNDGLEEAKDLPAAFPGVAKSLPVVEEVLRAMKSRLAKNDKETQTDKSIYQEMKQIFEECRTKTTKLEEIFSEVIPQDAENPWTERYRDLAEPGESVEKLMKEVLKGIIEVAKTSSNDGIAIVDEPGLQKLQAALKEVARLPASLIEEKKAGYVFTNTSSGLQANYLGKRGHQNINYGPSPQFTGDSYGAINLNTPAAAADASPPVVDRRIKK